MRQFVRKVISSGCSAMRAFTAVITVFISCASASAGIDVSFNADLLRLMNSERAKAGVPPLSMSATLNRAAQIRAMELMTNNSHTRPNGSSCFSVLSQVTSYRFMQTAENIAAGQKTAAAAMQSWMNSFGHKTNILNGAYTRVGLAAYVPDARDSNLSGYPIYWVQLFADSAPDDPLTPSPGSGALLYGASQIWRKGVSHTSGLTFVVAAEPESVLDVRLDSQPFDTVNWIKGDAEAQYDGSTSVLVRDYYLNSALVGSHRISIVISPDVPIDTTFTVVNAERDLSSLVSIASPSWALGSADGMSISVSGVDRGQLAAVICDTHALVEDLEYNIADAASGFTITIEPSYLNTLSIGAHDLYIAFRDGEARTMLVVEERKDAGRSSSGGGCVAGVSLFALAALMFAKAFDRSRGK